MSEDEEKKQAEEEQREAEAQAQQEDREARTEDEGLNENSMDIGDGDGEDGEDNDSSSHRKRKKKDNDEDKENAEKDAENDAENNAEDTKEKAEDDIQDKKESEKGKGENTEDLNANQDKKHNDSQGEDNQSKAERNQPENENPENNTPENSNPEPSPESSGQELNPPEKMNAGDFGSTPSSSPVAEGEAGAAEGGAATGESVAAEGAAEAATVGGEAATAGGAAAAGGEAAAGTVAAAGGAAAAAPVALIVVIVVIIIIAIIGAIGFFTTMPQFLWNRLKEIAQSVWDGLQGYVIGMDESTVNKDDIIYTAQYLYDMGYDLVGMGFAESVEIYGQKDENGKEIPVEDGHSKNEIKKVDAPYLRAYLVAENRTYLINNYTFNLKDFASSFFDGSLFDEGMDTWGTGMIDLDSNLLERLGMPLGGLRLGEYNLGELVKGVKIERSTNTMRIRRWNIHWDFWNAHRDYTYYSLEGWTGRYGKPFELLLTLHVATMAPDLVKEFALNPDLDAKVHVKLRDTDFSGVVLVDGKTIDELEEAGTYSEETIEALRKFEKKRASDINTAIPYISSVTNHWFRNVYFEGKDSEGVSGQTKVGVDEDGDDIEDYNEATGAKTQKTRNLTASDNVYSFGDETDAEMNFSGDMEDEFGDTAAAELGGAKITLKGQMEDGVTQIKDAVRGVTNPTTKELFNKKYYIYDGTVATAKKIQEARAKNDNSIKEKISFTKDSLQAFTILEESETLDAQYIYRDLKELVIELGYFEREDFDEIEKQVLEWPIPDYIPGEWPNREIEKQTLEYGTLIACDETVADSLGMSVSDLRKMTGNDDDDDDSDDDDYKKTLKGTLFIGDSYFEGLKNNVNIEDAEYYVKSGSTPAYWLKNIATLPASASKICVYLGVNDPDQHQQMKDLIDALRKKYEGTKIYVIEVMHLGSNYNNVDEINKKIDAFNYQVREKCKTIDTVRFIDASEKLISNGYLKNPDSSGIHMQASDYTKWAQNIAYKIKDTRLISNNDTDEEFVTKFLKAAKEITTYVKENNFEYGNAEYMPPKSDGTTNDDGSKKISCDRLVSWALYKCGYTDQPENGLCVSANGDFIEYCESKEWKRITNVDDVQAGDIVFTNQLDDKGKKAGHVFICAGDGLRYDCGSQKRIDAESQPFKESIGSDFMCAYRVTGDGVINAGFEEGLDVVAMANGKVTEIYDESNNIFSDTELAKRIYGESGETVEDTVEGREQSLDGIRIKITDKALKGYVLVMYGFDINGISKGDEVKVGDCIGSTVNSDICLILIDKDKAAVEDIEEYIKVPKKTKNSSTGIYGDLEAIDENSTDAEKVRAAVSYFVEIGFSVEGACGIVGNLIQETNLDTTCVTGSYRGLAQWDAAGRWAKVKEWMASEGYNETSFAGQIRAIYECPSETAQMTDAQWEELKGLTDLKKAAELFCVYYERCVNGQDATVWYKPGSLYQDLNKRKLFAQNAYDIYMGDDSKGLKDGAE